MEWLTTGRMIDRLKVGEVAENNRLDKQVVTRLKHGELVGIDPHNHYDIVRITLTEPVLKSKWRILPNYVSFEEAIKALSNDKTVRCHFVDDGVYIRLHQTNTMRQIHNMRSDVNLKELIHAGWTIEGDNS